MHSTLALVLALAPAALSGPLAAQKDEAPPGLVFVKGGTTVIGSEIDDLMPFIEQDYKLAGPLSPEFPQHQMRVDDFFLMVSEITCEQYEAYVRATGTRPPVSWADRDTADAARMDFLKAEAEKPLANRAKFDETEWWRRSWQDVAWAVPAGEAAKPVAWVDYQDVSGYARWAGLRLMTEFEYQRAVRGSSKRPYPWGDEWDGSKAGSRDSVGNASFPVGTFPGGVSEEGVYDLAGNVWEWTASPFTSYPGWKVKEIKVGKGSQQRKEYTVVDWDSNQRVVVGGSFSTSKMAVRCTTRRPTERNQATDAVGFRCAASIAPGRDMAETVIVNDVPVERRPAGVTYDPSLATAADRWQFEKGTAQITGGDGSSDLPGYAVITGYEYTMFAPVDEGVIEPSSIALLRSLCNNSGPVHVGVLATTQPTIVPDMAAGTYLVAFRGKGEDAAPPEEGEDEESEEGEEGAEAAVEVVEWPADLDLEMDNWIFFDADGAVAGFLPVEKMEYAKARANSVSIQDSTRQIITLDEDGEEVITQEPVDLALFTGCALSKGGRRGWLFDLPIKYEKGRISEEWRTPR